VQAPSLSVQATCNSAPSTDSHVRAQVSYAIGVAQPLSVHVDTYGTGSIPDKQILAAVLKKFDFRPGAAALAARRSPACLPRPRWPPF